MEVYRSTGDFNAASSLYEKYSSVSEEGPWLGLRGIVLARKLPRRMLLQPLTLLQEGVFVAIGYSYIIIYTDQRAGLSSRVVNNY